MTIFCLFAECFQSRYLNGLYVPYGRCGNFQNCGIGGVFNEIESIVQQKTWHSLSLTGTDKGNKFPM